jgi:hypothetical protein
MKYFPFKILILCILLPPVLYIVTLQAVERYLHDTYARELEEIYIGDTKPLFEGYLKVEDAVNRNIDRFLQEKPLLHLGVKAKVTVTTKENRIVYPAAYPEDNVKNSHTPSIPIAEENYRLLNEGLIVSLDLSVAHNHLFSNAILGFYIVLSLLVLSVFYRAGVRRSEAETREKEQEIERLLKLQSDYNRQMVHLGREREQLATEITKAKQRLEDEKEKALRSEDELFDEMVSLEEKLSANVARQEDQLKEIEALKEKIEHYERRTGGKHKAKASETAQKRFKTLYKNVRVNDRAADGFAGLTPEMQLKAEEVIHQLNEDASLVTIKRKVFGKKNRETVLEVIFAYKGRLYFRNSKESGVEILSIGTKHTQAKDLSFLDNL